MTRFAAILVASLAASASPAHGAPKRLPNVVFILADDLGYGDLGVHGQTRIATPHIDRLAAEGTRFTQTYAGSTVCAPSRAVMMTGLHSGHARIRGNARVPLQPGDVTVAEVLKTRGYRTGLVGKWGLGDNGTTGHPNRQGFDEFFGYLNQSHAHNYYTTHLWRNEVRVPLKNVVPDETESGAGVASERFEYAHDLIADEALAFVDRNQDRPFFLYLAFTLPHANNEGKSQGIEVPDLGAYAAKDWPPMEKAFAATVTRLDRDVGRLLDRLKALGIDEQTLVLFSSDNGAHKEGGHDAHFFDSNGPFRGIKRDLYDGGIHVPMFVRWPGRVPAGKVSDVPWGFWDVLPTLAKLAGAKTPARLDGVDVSQILLGAKAKLVDRFFYWEFHERGFAQAARWERWKAVRPAGKPIELYDLARDAGEADDVAAQHSDVVMRMTKFLASARTPSKEFPITAAR